MSQSKGEDEFFDADGKQSFVLSSMSVNISTSEGFEQVQPARHGNADECMTKSEGGRGRRR